MHHPGHNEDERTQHQGAWSRRGFLALTGGATAGLLTATGASPALAGAASSGDAFDDLRATCRDLLTGGSFDPTDPAFSPHVRAMSESAVRYRSSMLTVDDRTALWTDLPLGASSTNLHGTAGRLRAMALAYATPGTDLTGDATAAELVADGLDWLCSTYYTPTTTTYGNSWHWDIGTPSHLVDTCVLVYPALTPDRINAYCASLDHFRPAIGRYPVADANQADVCRIFIVRGAVQKNASKIDEARTAAADLFQQSSAGDGLHGDGSYVFHNGRPYNGAYGMTYFNSTTAMLELLTGSAWPVTDPNHERFLTAPRKAIIPLVFNGLLLDSVRGRGISRWNDTDATAGAGAALTLIRIAALTDDRSLATEYRATAKGWLLRNTVSAPSGIRAVQLARSVLDRPAVRPRAESVGHVQYPAMDRAVHRGKGWAFSISMCSNRISYYSSINGENLQGWHTGEGMTQLYLDDDPGQYNDAFWPTVFAKKLPGTTVDLRDFTDAEQGAWSAAKSTAAWAGGAVIDGAYGAVGMHLDAMSVTLTGRKSWFCLDDCVVALGAGITSTDDRYINTVVEQRKVPEGTGLTVDGAAQPSTVAWSASFSAPRWAHVDGVAGYVFPEPLTLQAYRNNWTGSWNRINSGGPTSPHTRQYITLQRDHGKSPTDASYQYVLLPGATAARTAAWSAAPTATVLANTEDVQAVSKPALGLTMANFFAGGTAGPITVSGSAACVVMREHKGRLTIGVSDPTHDQSTVEVVIDRSGYRPCTADPDVTVLSTSGAITLRVNVAGASGTTRTVTLTGPRHRSGRSPEPVGVTS
ncbi:polysaccharide lyase 8 family protein [Streptomyces sp. NPDC007861]|uniref:polysaccharide lyase 8 family protein n=1 Tax=Streptomyces sp. NPDC007861 TaxID=3154893 RepID=UPI0033E5EB45